jgi:hypothetical protein
LTCKHFNIGDAYGMLVVVLLLPLSFAMDNTEVMARQQQLRLCSTTAAAVVAAATGAAAMRAVDGVVAGVV